MSSEPVHRVTAPTAGGHAGCDLALRVAQDGDSPVMSVTGCTEGARMTAPAVAVVTGRTGARRCATPGWPFLAR